MESGGSLGRTRLDCAADATSVAARAETRGVLTGGSSSELASTGGGLVVGALSETFGELGGIRFRSDPGAGGVGTGGSFAALDGGTEGSFEALGGGAERRLGGGSGADGSLFIASGRAIWGRAPIGALWKGDGFRIVGPSST